MKSGKPAWAMAPRAWSRVTWTAWTGWPVAAGSDHSRLFVGYQDDPGQPGGGTFVTMDSALGKFASVSYEFAITRLGDAFWAESPPPSTNEE